MKKLRWPPGCGKTAGRDKGKASPTQSPQGCLTHEQVLISTADIASHGGWQPKVLHARLPAPEGSPCGTHTPHSYEALGAPVAKPLTHNGGESARGLLPSHQFVQFWVVKFQALQEDHVTSLALGVENVQQPAWGGPGHSVRRRQIWRGAGLPLWSYPRPVRPGRIPPENPIPTLNVSVCALGPQSGCGTRAGALGW